MMPDKAEYQGLRDCHAADTCDKMDCMGRQVHVWICNKYVVVYPVGWEAEGNLNHLNYDGMTMWVSLSPGGVAENAIVVPHEDLAKTAFVVYAECRDAWEEELGDFHRVSCPRAEKFDSSIPSRFYYNGEYMAMNPDLGGPYFIYKRITDAPVLSEEGNDAKGWEVRAVESLAEPNKIHAGGKFVPNAVTKNIMGLAWGEFHTTSLN